MIRVVATVVAAIVPLALVGVAPPESAPVGVVSALPGWGWPLTGTPAVVRAFDPPAAPWSPGHRGVDLAGTPGETVLAAGAGVVAFAGMVAGRGVVSVDHAGGLRTTYEPVSAVVHIGDAVGLGAPLGTLAAGHPGCGAPACLHWGLRRGLTYLNPLLLLRPLRVRLKPLTLPPAVALRTPRRGTPGRRGRVGVLPPARPDLGGVEAMDVYCGQETRGCPQASTSGYPQIAVRAWWPGGEQTSLAPMTLQTDAVGRYGERVAMRTLALAGLTILDRNWRCTEGELDLVARDEGVIVFCEVKTRRSHWFGEPVEAVNRTRVRRIRGAATAWLAAHPSQRGEVRFDVICVFPQRTGPARVEHVMGAF